MVTIIKYTKLPFQTQLRGEHKANYPFTFNVKKTSALMHIAYGVYALIWIEVGNHNCVFAISKLMPMIEHILVIWCTI